MDSVIPEGFSNQNNSMICRGTEPRWLIRGVSAVQMCLLPPTSCACTTTDAPPCSPTLCQNSFPPQAPAANMEGWGMLWDPAELCRVMSERGGTHFGSPLCAVPAAAARCQPGTGSTELSSAEPARRGLWDRGSQVGRVWDRSRVERVAGRRDRAEQTAHSSQGISSSSCLILWTLTGMPLQLRPLQGDVRSCPYLGEKAWSQAGRLPVPPPHCPLCPELGCACLPLSALAALPAADELRLL